MPEEPEIDFVTVALAHKLVDRETAERCQGIIDDEVQAGKPARKIEEVFREEGVLTEEEVWAVIKAQDRMLRDAKVAKNRIGPYEIEGKLGEGGLGVVYKARQLSLGRVVALKVLHEKWMADEEFRKRFLLEARVVGRLNHQNLIQVIDIGKHKNTFYFSMEFVDGETVESIIDRDGAMPVERAVDIAFQIAQAIQYLRQFKIVHRDIKPGNIMLNSSGAAKLGDFGFVKSSLDNILSSTGEVLGTPDYMSPEVAKGDSDIDWRSDVYSLGASFYHMLAGKPPFSGSASIIMEKHIKEVPPPLREIRKDLSDLVCLVVDKMMEKKPEERYPSMAELVDDLEMLRLNERTNKSGSAVMRALERDRNRSDDMKERIAAQELEIANLRFQLKISLAGIVALAAAFSIMWVWG